MVPSELDGGNNVSEPRAADDQARVLINACVPNPARRVVPGVASANQCAAAGGTQLLDMAWSIVVPSSLTSGWRDIARNPNTPHVIAPRLF